MELPLVGTSSKSLWHSVTQGTAGICHLCHGLTCAWSLSQDTGSLYPQPHDHLWGPAQCQGGAGPAPSHPLSGPPS